MNGSDRIVPVDIDVVMQDPALIAMPDGPAKRFLRRLSVELDHDPGVMAPMLLVRRNEAPRERFV